MSFINNCYGWVYYYCRNIKPDHSTYIILVSKSKSASYPDGGMVVIKLLIVLYLSSKEQSITSYIPDSWIVSKIKSYKQNKVVYGCFAKLFGWCHFEGNEF